jgi:hypothetical protein
MILLDLSEKNLQELTEEEKLKPYSKYYYLTPGIPDLETLEGVRVNKPMDPVHAVTPEKINDMLLSGYLAVENGYCLLENGMGYVAVNTKMPGVTFDMYKWWTGWWPHEDLRYKIWSQCSHIKCGYRWTLEYIGEELEDIIFINPVSEVALGMDLELFKKSGILMVDGANAISKPCNSPAGIQPIAATVCHFLREIPGGIEMRSRFWIGYHAGENGLFLTLSPGKKIPDQMPYNLAVHNAYEMANLRKLLPPLYEEMKAVNRCEGILKII